jgi:hypothetical protein
VPPEVTESETPVVPGNRILGIYICGSLIGFNGFAIPAEAEKIVSYAEPITC